MHQEPLPIDLGFTQDLVPAGTHICQIYDERDERDDALLRFLLSGLQSRERCASFTNNFAFDRYSRYFADHGLSATDAVTTGALTHEEVDSVYFQGGDFDPDRMLDTLRNFHAEAMTKGFQGARVIGEMTSNVDKYPGGSRLLEYEINVSKLQEDHPVTTVCQYCAKDFDGEKLMNIMKVHPMMYVSGVVIRNPFFVPNSYR